jgi:hypothetical protein
MRKKILAWFFGKLEKINEYLDHRDDMRAIARYKKRKAAGEIL